jgi:hypothetical protein
VVSQLAKRHGIRVTLKASAYGGTAGVVLIPRHLVVTEEAFRSGLPGEPAMAQLVANGNSGLGELDGMPGLGQPPGVRISGPLRRSALGAANGAVAPSGPAGASTPMTPVASPPRPGQASRPPWELSRETGPLPARPGPAGPAAPGGPSGSGGPNGPGTNGDFKDLPRRVKQANLAPQLRDDPPPRRTTLASSGPPGFAGSSGPAGPGGPGGPSGPSGPSPAEIRQTMSALQRGWQEGRSRRLAEQAAGEPAGGGPGSPAGAIPGAAPTDNSPANEEARGNSDGS